ncbi:MAG: oligoendopeptidase F [Verrucomicrobiota bacterium]
MRIFKVTCSSLVITVLFTAALSLFADDHNGKEPEQISWDLTALYPDDEAWNTAREEVLGELEELENRKGTLGDGATGFYETHELLSDIYRKALRVHSYASLKADEDLRNAPNQEKDQLAQQMFSQVGQAASWIDPEILKLGREKVEAYLKEEPRLAPFAHSLDNTLRNAPHTLSDEGEQILAAASQPLRAGFNTYGLLANAEIPWPELELANGETVTLNSQGYSTHRQSENRDDRKKVFDAYWGKWGEYENSIGMTLNSHLQAQAFLSNSRNYETVLQRELFQDKLPEEIYRTLVREVNEALPTLHRYFKLRARMLGIDQMHYYDIYPPLVSLDQEFSLEDAKEMTLDAMSIFGEEWVTIQREAMEKPWMHVYPQPGKRSGAYQNGSAYDVHPYLLLNFDGTFNAVSTFAHEWGHGMHTLYANREQPFESADYSTFIAEIPAISFELLLEEDSIKNAQSDEERLFYLGNRLEAMRGTFFRQTMFAEFELALYEAVERGEALSGEKISSMYEEILKRYHGHDEGVVIIDDAYTREWMFVPHFYFNMYVFQYATSMTAGAALYDMMLTEGQPAVDRFIQMLKDGGSDYPHELLKKAGVDLTQPEPYRALVKRMEETMDEMEAILDRMDRRSSSQP